MAKKKKVARKKVAKKELPKPNDADLKIIKKIEALLQIEFEQSRYASIGTQSYAVNEAGAVTGFAFCGCDIGPERWQSFAGMLILLTDLTQLDLQNNILTDVSALASLSNLTQLVLFGNELTDISALASLTKLTQLIISRNILTDVSTLASLTKLTFLELRDNKLTDISVLKGLTNLTQLDLHGNEIKELPEWITQLGMKIYCNDRYYETGIYLGGNPLETPPIDIVKDGREAVLNYFDSIKTKDVIKLYEAKLLIVGPGSVGKTVMANRLVNDTAPETGTTEGIDILPWMVSTDGIEKLRINLWDFSGQDIDHATHQFFLTKRSVYLLLWEARTDDDVSCFSYWLNIIKLLSDNSPVIIAMNKCDVRVKTINETAIVKEFPNVVGFHKVSARENTNIDGLRSSIIEQIASLDHIGTELSGQWVKIRKELEKKKDDNFISYKQYKAICREHGLDSKQAGFLVRYYHELGIILYFGDNRILKDVVFLNPEWATAAVYRIADYKPIKLNHGRFAMSILPEVWHDYPEDKYGSLLELMMKFELCFKLDGVDEYIIPELLDSKQPEFDWDKTNNLRFEYEYGFMPAGIIARFMSRQHTIIKDEFYWKDGVLFEWEGNEALVVCHPYSGCISIRIVGDNRKGLLSIVRRDIQHIHETLNNPQVEELIPCNCNECNGKDEPYLHKLDKIRNRLSKGKTTIECGGVNCNDADIRELLGDLLIRVETKDGVSNVYNYYIAGDKIDMKGNMMKNEGFVFNDGQQNFADIINGITYNQDCGVSNEAFTQLQAEISKLKASEHEELMGYFKKMTEANTDNEKESVGSSIKKFMKERGVAALESVATSGLTKLACVLATAVGSLG